MPELEKMQVFIVSSPTDAKISNKFWVHLSTFRREDKRFSWANISTKTPALDPQSVAALSHNNSLPCAIILCLSAHALSEIADSYPLKELIRYSLSKELVYPLILSPCSWREKAELPHKLMPLNGGNEHDDYIKKGDQDKLLMTSVQRLKNALDERASLWGLYA